MVEKFEYLDVTNLVNEKILKLTSVIGVLLFYSFGILDVLLYPQFKYLFLKFRFLFIGIPISICFIILLLKNNIKVKIIAFSIIAILVSINICAVIFISKDINQFYYTGLVFLILYVTNISNLPFKYNIFTVIIINLVFIVFSIVFPFTNKYVLINDVIGLFFVSFAGLFSNYIIDYYRLRDLELKIKNEIEIADLYHKSTHDKLTNLKNKYIFKQLFEQSWENAKRDRKPISILMIDIDDFKKYNDNYGHIAGDNVLKKIALILQENVKRNNDVVARFGGEEFIIMLYDTDEYGAKMIANNILKNINKTNIKHDYATFGRVTVSIGCSTIIPKDNLNPNDLIIIADEALYKAKKEGKNKVI
ncbi:conserved hypothetical protein [Deferribacter desulfuricans SSM1]|uniref:diguanylate cyclase n=1 Tax=Deferribacter desulfuricans (strain DSM 14783 / JCM 11476 / NBRC 101012 / SSM1) TaxID=639282 RepID=D3P9B9_DEFDS|nr:GGDEF domain-containing protein [Deferribacter desulfuricans]BAI81309.1 conserved hypothetical protein [Deferribacter desulfuricans SSM1]